MIETHRLQNVVFFLQIIGNSNEETNYQLIQLLLSTNKQVSKLGKASVNNSSANIKLKKTQLSKMVQLGGFLGRLLAPLL